MGHLGAFRRSVNLAHNQFLLGNIQMAAFAKYDRSKPHLNVGTIGKYCVLKLMDVQVILITVRPL